MATHKARASAPRFAKPDATGRSSQKVMAKGKVREIPKGEPFVQHSRELLASAAFRSLSIHARRILDFLEIEHMNHDGRCNGDLKATYDQLRDWGVSRRKIKPALEELESMGFIKRQSFPCSRIASTYELTYFKTPRDVGYCPPTHEWQKISHAKTTKKKTGSVVPPCGTRLVPPCGTKTTKLEKADIGKNAENSQSDISVLVPPCGTPYISWYLPPEFIREVIHQSTPNMEDYPSALDGNTSGGIKMD